MQEVAASRAVWLGFVLLVGASCSDSLRLIVVDQGAGNAAVSAGSSGAGTASGATSGSGVSGAGGMGASAGSGATAGSLIGSGGGVVSDGGTQSTPDAGAAGEPGAGGTPDVPPWDEPPRYTASYVSYAYPSQYLSYMATDGFIAPVDMGSDAERQRASFDMIPGLYERACVSFRAQNKIGTFLRHAQSRIHLHATDETPLFYGDATFCVVPGMADPQGVSFRSSNYKQRVIHLRNKNELWIDDVPETSAPDYASFAADSTFYEQRALTAPSE